MSDDTLILPDGYAPALTPRQTEQAILDIKSFFQDNLAFELNLLRVTAPLFVPTGTGINDDLNGVERPVRFEVPALDDAKVEIVHSLAKWKRLTLAELGCAPGEGIYTDMNALRPDEVLDNTHSIYVDQWDWERVISAEERTLDLLRQIVARIYDVIRRTERHTCYHYPQLSPVLPDSITFVHSEELAARWPELPPRQRELEICRQHKAVFVIGIGAELADGQPHDGRAPDYDDWSTPTADGRKGLNGDILVYNPVLDSAFEMSSMGIRVDPAAMERQLELRGAADRRGLYFHRRLLAGELPLCVGGGIGQSRLCMFFLRKAHIGEIQASLWPEAMRQRCAAHRIPLL